MTTVKINDNTAYKRQYTLPIMAKMKITKKGMKITMNIMLFTKGITHTLYQFDCLPKNYCYVFEFQFVEFYFFVKCDRSFSMMLIVMVILGILVSIVISLFMFLFFCVFCVKLVSCFLCCKQCERHLKYKITSIRYLLTM